MRIILSIVLLLFFSSQASAGFWQTTWDEFSSPITTDGKYYLMGGVALTGILATNGMQTSIGDSIQKDAVEHKPLGKFSKAGDIAGQMVPNVIYFASMYGAYYFLDEEIYKSRSFHMLKSTLYAAVVSTVLKKIVQEPRPNNPTDKASFPSGHSTTAFAFAAVVGTEHEWYWAVPAYGLATFVAYSRINDNVHRLHDVVGGAVIGITYGLSLHYLYNQQKEDQHMAFLPYGNGLSFQYNLEF